MYHFNVVPQLTPAELLQGIILGAVGALVATMFVVIFRLVGKLTSSLEENRILLATCGGLSIGIIAYFFPQTLFFSEEQIATVIQSGATLTVSYVDCDRRCENVRD